MRIWLLHDLKWEGWALLLGNLPVVYVALCFHLVFNLVGQGGEEVYFCDALYFIDGFGVEGERFVVFYIVVDESDGFGMSAQTEDYFEECTGYFDVVFSDAVGGLVVKNWAASDIDYTLFQGPVVAVVFEFFPVAA